MATSVPSGTNTYIPHYDMKAKLTINYSRNPKSFAVNALTQVTPVDYMRNHWLKLKPEAAGRILAHPEEVIWADGQPRPRMQNFAQDYEFLEYACTRKTYSHPIGYLASEQGVWDIVAAQTAVLAQNAMTRRAYDFYNLIMTSGNYLSGHTDTATNWGGGLWGAATTANGYIKKTINMMRQRISKSTYGAVNGVDFALVMPPAVAEVAARSAEIADFVSQQVTSPDFLQYKLWQKQAENYGLPPVLYGCRVVVDETVYTASKPITTGAATAAFSAGTNSVALIAAPGDVKNPGEGASAFSSVHTFLYRAGEMEVELEDQPFNRLKIIHVTDTYDLKFAAKETACLATNVVS